MTLIYWWTWASSKWIFKNFFRCRVYNPERVPTKGSVIIASNHESFIDPPFIGSSLSRPINYLARENIFSHWLSGPYFRRLNAVPVDRDGGGAKGLKIILDRLINNNGIIIFPEGTRTFDGKILSSKAGIGLAIIKSQAPVVPVRVWTFKAYNRNLFFPKPLMISVKFGKPLDIEYLRDKAKTCSRSELRNIYQEAAEMTMCAVQKLRPIKD